MALAHSITYLADRDDVWGGVIDIVTSAGYLVHETDEASRRIVYQAQLNGAHNVTISVSGIKDKALVSVKIVSVQPYLLEGSFHQRLLNYIVEELDKRYTKTTTSSATTSAPGSGPAGCAGVLLLIISLGLCALATAAAAAATHAL
jgi:hypothetical protein